MVKNVGTCLFKEARLNTEPAFPGSTIAFAIPSPGAFGTRPHVKRTVVTEQYAEQDEDAFSRRHLATEGSIFFRSRHEYPHSLLWRVLDSRKVLEIQAVDLDHDFKDHFEANLTLVFQFPSPIRPFCVAFAEPADRDALILFAITTTNELYTITLHRDFFSSAVASEQEIDSWCKRSEPALFSGRVPYRLVAQSPDELLVSLDDGAICRLFWDKTKGLWDGSRYQQSNWSVRGLLSWKSQPMVHFDNVDLAISAAAAVAISPDGEHIVSVCLDHTLRAWNIASGKQGVQMDLLGQDHDDRALEKTNGVYFIGPSHSKLMAVLEVSGGVGGAAYHIATYSPKQHQFKFWGVRDADEPLLGIYDAADGVDLIPPIDELMNTTVWTLEEFHIIPGPVGWGGSEIWIRARSGPSSKVYSLKFDLADDPETLSRTWRNNWVSVGSGPLTVEGLKSNRANPGEREQYSEYDDSESTEQWLDFLFYPGRFTVATLETALTILRRGLEPARSSRSSSRASLKERICHAITALAVSKQDAKQSAAQSRGALASQWQVYYGLVKDLHKRRGESLCLAFDKKSGMPWLVLSDYISSIRNGSELEIMALNAATLSSTHKLSKPLRNALDKPESRDVAQLLNASASFRHRLPLSVQQGVMQQVEMDILQSRSLTIIDRMEWIEGHSEILQHVSDDDLSLLVEELGTEVKDLSTETFLRAIETLAYQEEGLANSKKQITRYGLGALLRVSQEMLEADHQTLLDLLTLVLFMFVELEGETPEDFDASKVFVELIAQYKECMMVSWLASHVWAYQSHTGPASELLNRALSENLKIGKKLPFTQTIIEGTYGINACDLPLPKHLKTNLLTQWSRGWITCVLKEKEFENVVEDITGYLLAQREYGLALDYSKFLTESNWATYLKGRLHIALGEHALAQVCFQKCAYHLALGIFNIEEADSANLVDEVERNLFSEGLSQYYTHIVNLFNEVKEYWYVADFARLGLRSLNHQDEDLRADLLEQLFRASIHTSRFQDAHSALTRQRKADLKHSELKSLVTSMISQSQATELLKFPFVGLADEVESILLLLCQNTLNLASNPPYHQVLFSFRISRNNFRGAASIMYERLQRLKTTSSKHHEPADESLIQCYLMIINTLSSVSKEDAYILAEQKIDGTGPPQWALGQGKKMLKRHIITLETLRREYQAELDRVAAIESGQFPFMDPVDDMDIL